MDVWAQQAHVRWFERSPEGVWPHRAALGGFLCQGQCDPLLILKGSMVPSGTFWKWRYSHRQRILSRKGLEGLSSSEGKV